MALLKRQTYTYEVFDDQGPALINTFAGNWTRGTRAGIGLYNDTYTATVTPGSYFTFQFEGTQALLYGGVAISSDNTSYAFPTFQYTTDGSTGGYQQPSPGPDGVLYIKTPLLASGDHVINVTVTEANLTNPMIIDYYLIIPVPGDTSGVETTRAAPSGATPSSSGGSSSTPVGAIVGGVVGGIAGIAILVVLAFYFLHKRSRGGQAYYFEKPGAADVMAGEDQIEPFNPTTASPPSTAGLSRPGPQSAYSEGSSTQPLSPNVRQTFVGTSQSGPSEAGMSHVTSNSAQPRTGKAALIAQQYDTPEPVQYQDSGVRFNETVEQEAGPSQLPTEVPPTYTPN